MQLIYYIFAMKLIAWIFFLHSTENRQPAIYMVAIFIQYLLALSNAGKYVIATLTPHTIF